MSSFPLYPASLSAALLHPFVPRVTPAGHIYGVSVGSGASGSSLSRVRNSLFSGAVRLLPVIKDASVGGVDRWCEWLAVGFMVYSEVKPTKKSLD